MMENNRTGSTASSTGNEQHYDAFFIGAVVCICIGSVLLIAGFIRLIVWLIRIKRDASQEKRKRRHLEHMRYLEEYCIKAGDSPNDIIIKNNNTVTDSDSVFKWDEGLVNAGYIGEDTLNRHSPKEPKLNAHINGSQPNSRPGSRPNSRPSSRASASSYTTGQVANGRPRGSVSGIEQHDDAKRLADVPV